MTTMKILPLLGYAILTAIGLLAITISLKLYRQFRLRYLLYYCYFIIFSYAFGFLDIIAKYFTHDIFGCEVTSPYVIETISLVFSFIAFPFIIFAWFYFIHMITELGKKRFLKVFKFGYFTIQAILIIIFAFIINSYTTSKGVQSANFSESILLIFNAVNRGIQIILLISLVIKPQNSRDPDLKKGLNTFGILYIFVILLHFILVHIVTHETFVCLIYPVAEFIMHVPPLLYLNFFLKKYYKDHSLYPIKNDTLSTFLAKFNITEREQEIISLILKGKSNREIEEVLYISYQTVKTHIYNIYKKLGIKNRWQLINLVQNQNNSQIILT